MISKRPTVSRGRSRPAATSKMERFVVIVNDWKPLTIIIKRSILDVGAALDPPLVGDSGNSEPPTPTSRNRVNFFNIVDRSRQKKMSK